MQLWKIKVEASRWPWQKVSGWVKCSETYGWFKSGSLLGRFGGGWNWSLGIEVGGTTILLNLLFGTIRISWGKKANDTNGTI